MGYLSAINSHRGRPRRVRRVVKLGFELPPYEFERTYRTFGFYVFCVDMVFNFVCEDELVAFYTENMRDIFFVQMYESELFKNL